MAETDLSPIPSIFISQNDGDALRAYLAQPRQPGPAWTSSHQLYFPGQGLAPLRIRWAADRLRSHGRGDLRIVLTSPSGTRSISNAPTRTPARPQDWIYYSVQHFYESSFGTWTASFSDEDIGHAAPSRRQPPDLRGSDHRYDHDGLDDAWELQHFGSLAAGPVDDPDHDGYSNAREQIMGTDPAEPSRPLELDLSLWDGRLARLSWPGQHQHALPGRDRP